MSGHAHRVTLLLSLLGLPYRRVDVDLRGGEHKQQPFLALNAFGQVPVLEDEGAVIADSNAILVYLAKRYQGQARWLPEDALGAAAVQRWLSVAAGQLASGPNAARLATLFGVPDPGGAAQARTHALLAVMDAELGRRDWLAGKPPPSPTWPATPMWRWRPRATCRCRTIARPRLAGAGRGAAGLRAHGLSHVGLRAA